MNDTFRRYEFPNRYGELREITVVPGLTISQTASVALILKHSVEGAEAICTTGGKLTWIMPDGSTHSLTIWGLTQTEERAFLNSALPGGAVRGEISDHWGRATGVRFEAEAPKTSSKFARLDQPYRGGLGA